ASSSLARVSANVVLPAPGVATARKSRGSRRKYSSNAARCQLRRPRNRSSVLFASSRVIVRIPRSSRVEGIGAHPRQHGGGRAVRSASTHGVHGRRLSALVRFGRSLGGRAV